MAFYRVEAAPPIVDAGIEEELLRRAVFSG
jgi:hypothetical protein